MGTPICIKCRGVVCVCHYLQKLASGGVDRKIADLAFARMQERHSPVLSCPCPECYRVRLGSWEVS